MTNFLVSLETSFQPFFLKEQHPLYLWNYPMINTSPLYLPFLTFLLPQHMYSQYAVLADDAVFLGRVVLLS